MVVGCVTLISINTLIFGFVLWLPQFFIQQGLSIARSFALTLVIAVGLLSYARRRHSHRRSGHRTIS